VLKRFRGKGLESEEQLKEAMKFKAFLLMSDAVNLEMNVQIMCDLVASNDGRMNGGIYSETF
jgi:hypothetical protein